MGAVRTPVLIGRGEELELLVAAWRRAADGRAALAVVHGEAGIGKTRLTREFTAQTEREDPTTVVAWGHAVPLSAGAIPYGMVADLLQDLAQAVGPSVVRGALGEDTKALAPLVPGVGPGAGSIDRLALFGSTQHLLRTLSSDRTVVLVIEDFHWADDLSADLVRFWVRTLDRARVLVVVTSREAAPADAWGERLAELARLPNQVDVHVGSLDDDEVAAQVRELTADLSVIERVQTLSVGNPLYVEELVSNGAAGLPETLRLDLASRLAALSSEQQLVLGYAAIEPRPFDVDVLALVTEVAGEPVGLAVDAGVAAGLLDSAGAGRWRFHHDLLREGVAASLPPSRRMHAHRRWAEVLGAGPSAAVDDVMAAADHWEELGPSREAFDALVRAALGAERWVSPRSSLSWWRRALNADARAPGAAAPDDRDQALAGLMFQVQDRREALAVITAEEANGLVVTELRRIWLRESRYALSLSLPDLHVEDVTPDELADIWRYLSTAPPSRLLFSALLRLISIRFGKGELVDCRAVLGRLIDVAVDMPAELGCDILVAEWHREVELQHAGPDVCLAHALTTVAGASRADSANRSYALTRVAFCYLDAGDLSRALSYGEAALGLIPGPEADVFWYVAAMAKAVPLFLLGRWDESLPLFASMAEDHHGDSLESAYMFRVLISLRRGEPDAVASLLTSWESREVERFNVFADTDNYVRAFAHAHVEEGSDPAGARLRLAAWMQEEDPSYFRFFEEALCLAARLSVAPGSGDADFVARIVEVADRSLNPEWPPEAAYAHQVAAYVARAAGTETVDGWLIAVAAWDALDIPFRTAECRLRLAEAQLDAGDRDDAVVVLERALEQAESLGARPLADEIRTLASRARLRLAGGAQTGTGGSRGAGGAGGLTAREHEVLQLLVTGQTNDQIGRTLFMSPRTASVHVSRILAKLGAANRTEVAAVAHRSGLVD